VRSTDPKRTFDRDDGSEGQVRNIRVQDETGDIRVALWGEKADLDIAPGDEVQLADLEIQDGWEDDIEGSAGWQSTVTVLGEADPSMGVSDAGNDDENESGGSDGTGLDAFGGDEADADTGADADADAGAGTDGGAAVAAAESGDSEATGEHVEFTGTVVQAGDPIILDDGEETISVESTADVTLGQKVTARGQLRDGTLDAEDVF
jgi:replication factor A1